MRQGTRFLIGPLVGVVAVAALTGCGSSDNDADPVLGPPTTEVTATTEVAETTAATVPETTPPIAPGTTAPRPVTTAPKPVAAPAPEPPALSAQELASLEAELSAIDAILNELAQSFSAD